MNNTTAALTLLNFGTCTITASQTGNTYYSAATPVTQSFTVTGQTQAITFAALPTQSMGTTVPALVASSTSGQAVSFTSTTTAVCTVSGTNGTTVSLVTPGSCTIAANQAGAVGYSAAPQVLESFSVTIGSQTISFAPLAGQALGAAPLALSATSSAALPVSFASNTPAVCKVSGTTLTLLTAGGCSVTASQSGTTSYTAAVPVTRELMVGATSQTITFNPVAAQSYAGTATTVALTATSSVGLPVSFTSGTDSVCTVTGSTVTLLSAGTCTLTAVQAGDSSYDAAAPVVQSFTVTGTAISIAVTSPVMSQTLQSPVTMTLTAAVSDNSGNTITNVAFYNGTSLMGTVTQFPYSIAIPNATAGSYSITAQATDSKGLTATSALVTVTAGSGAEQLYYISTDQLNTPRLITNSNGTTVWQWDGEAFGNTPPNSNPSNLGNFTFNMRFPEQYADAETGLYYNYFRDYNPATGGYIESDPIGLAGGQASTYAYVGGNPNNGIDPSGRSCVNLFGDTLCQNNGISFVVPTPFGYPDTLSSDDFFYHQYSVQRSLNGVDPDCVFQGIANNPTPGNPAPATPQGTINNAKVGRDNIVTSYLTEDIATGMPIEVNMAGVGDGSLFGPGYVARYVKDGVAYTTGEGTNWKQSPTVTNYALGIIGFQDWANEMIWGKQLDEIISKAKGKGKCGCPR